MNEETITLTDGNGHNPTKLNRQQYEALRKSGMLWEFHPDAPKEWPKSAPPAPPDAAAQRNESGARGREVMPDMLGERLVEMLRPIIGKATNDDGVDSEAWWIELTADEHRELLHLTQANEQLSGSGGSMSAKTESKQPSPASSHSIERILQSILSEREYGQNDVDDLRKAFALSAPATPAGQRAHVAALRACAMEILGYDKLKPAESYDDPLVRKILTESREKTLVTLIEILTRHLTAQPTRGDGEAGEDAFMEQAFATTAAFHRWCDKHGYEVVRKGSDVRAATDGERLEEWLTKRVDAEIQALRLAGMVDSLGHFYVDGSKGA